MKNEMFLEILERSQHIGDALTTMLYAVEAMKNIDNGEQQLREIGWNIESQIGTLQEYQAETQRILEQLKSEQRERAEPAENQGKMFSRAAARELFKNNAALLSDYDAIPFYRVIEILGKDAGIFIEKAMPDKGLTWGRDYGGYGLGDWTNEFVYESGFLKIVTECNNRIAAKAHRESEGGHIWDQLWEERCRKIDELDAEYDRKKEERRKKRAAAKEAKEKEEN